MVGGCIYVECVSWRLLRTTGKVGFCLRAVGGCGWTEETNEGGMKLYSKQEENPEEKVRNGNSQKGTRNSIKVTKDRNAEGSEPTELN